MSPSNRIGGVLYREESESVSVSQSESSEDEEDDEDISRSRTSSPIVRRAVGFEPEAEIVAVGTSEENN